MYSLVNQTTSSTALDVLHHQHPRVLVMQYIQRCGGRGLVYETNTCTQWYESVFTQHHAQDTNASKDLLYLIGHTYFNM